MVFSLTGRSGRRVVELDELPLKEILPEPNESTHDLISIAHTFLTQLKGGQNILIVRAFQIWTRLSLELASSQFFGSV